MSFSASSAERNNIERTWIVHRDLTGKENVMERVNQEAEENGIGFSKKE